MSIFNWIKKRWIYLYVIGSLILIELIGVAVTSHCFYIRRPWIFIFVLGIVFIILFYLKTYMAKFVVGASIICAFGIVDLIFIIIFEMTGQYFDFSMFELRNDAFGILESFPINFVYFFCFGILLSIYLVFGYRVVKRNPQELLPIKRRYIYLPLSLLFMIGMLVFSISNSITYSDFYEELKYSKNENSYADYGIIGNFASQIASGTTKKNDKEMNEAELTNFLYRENQIKKSNFPENKNKNYNVVTILAESLEWMSFMSDKIRYPNGLKLVDPLNKNRDDSILLRELFPNLYRFYDDSIVFNNFHSKEKTDISENYSYLGVYPTNAITNYDFYTNTLSSSMANTLKAIDPNIKTQIFHNGAAGFYNRDVYELQAGFDYFMAGEEMALKAGFSDWMGNGERNLDHEMIEVCADEMFPIDSRFYTYIISITQHGQYTYRKSLEEEGYYEKLSLYGINVNPESPATDQANSFINYVASALEFDHMVGTLYDELEERGLLENTVITIFGDHNCYYSGLSNYVKDIPSNFNQQKNDDRNYVDLYRVPCMMRVPSIQHQVNDKFTCTADIVPTIYDVLGLSIYGNVFYGNSIFSSESSVLYSRAYNFFCIDNAIYSSLNKFKYIYKMNGKELDMYDITDRTSRLVEKIKYTDQIFYNDYYAKPISMSQYKLSSLNTYGDLYTYKMKTLNS